MATPTRSQAVSTPKSHLSNTPSRPMASPRPGTSTTAQKSLAYKSPAVKTPASVHGHAHTVSVSSQPSSTPLTAAAIHDELLNLNSPAAALINSIVSTGLTPLASGQEGLGIAPHLQGVPERDGPTATNPEAERLQRLHQVVNALKTKMVGRGITREGVERVARVQGFEALWDENILTIAGNIVELEINFDSLVKDKVRDLVLKLNSADGESHVQHDSTTILKSQIGVDGPLAPKLPVDDLRDFSLNLQYFAQMDRVNTSPNAFDIIENLYTTFRDIWEEEKRRMKWTTDISHLCRGSVGRPHLGKKPRLGMSIDYWKGRHADGVTAVPDQNSADGNNIGVFRANLSCEVGSPSMPSSLEWLSPKILEETRPENVLNADDHLQQPAWLDTAGTSDSSAVETKTTQADSNLGQGQLQLDKSLNAHFVCELDPEVLVPVNTVLRMNSGHNMIETDQMKITTFPRALQNARNTMSMDHKDEKVEVRWSRRLLRRANGTDLHLQTHSYALYSAAHGAELWCYPLSQIRFIHPRELAIVFPVLRQHAMLWALLRSLIIDPVCALQHNPLSKALDKRRVVKRSNARTSTLAATNGGLPHAPGRQGDPLDVDISLDVLTDPRTCRVEVFAPLHNTSALKRGSSFIHLTVLIGLNGVIDVSELTGVSSDSPASLKNKVGRILSSTEDIGMALEWLVERVTSEIQT